MHRPPECLYAAFDTYPAPKGAAIHIREFSAALFEHFGSGLLLALGSPELPAWQFEGNCEIRRMISDESNFLRKAGEFSQFVQFHAELLKNDLRLAHFRDPWGGLPILRGVASQCRTVFEVNALPSIELPVRFRNITSAVLDKIRNIENECLQRSDAIICPSDVIRNFLIERGVAAGKISVIRNGAVSIDPAGLSRPAGAPADYLVYVGAVQSWQGIEILFKAMTFLADMPDLKLVLCVSGSRQRLKFLNKLAERMQINDRLVWQYRLNQNELLPWLAHARISVAPLTECTRNLQQGCCPLKILEAMAMKVPIIASDIPVVRELVDHNQTGWLVRPDRPSELARAVRILLANRSEADRIKDAAHVKATRDFSWQKAAAGLRALYKQLTGTGIVSEKL